METAVPHGAGRGLCSEGPTGLIHPSRLSRSWEHLLWAALAVMLSSPCPRWGAAPWPLRTMLPGPGSVLCSHEELQPQVDLSVGSARCQRLSVDWFACTGLLVLDVSSGREIAPLLDCGLAG